MSRYTDVHRLFLQSLISRRCLSERLAQKLYRRACEIVASAENTDPSREPYEQALEQVANAISPLSLEIRALVDENSREKMIAIVNTKGDAIAQVATDFSPNEIAYFKLIVECIMLAPAEAFSLSSIAAIKESTNLPSKMTKTEAEATLNAFVARGWLYKSKRGRYSLSTRSLLELSTYLKQTFEDEIQECTICMEIVTKGIACSTARCKTHMHTHCYENYRVRHRVCPACDASWETKRPVPVGEDAAQDGPERRRVKRRPEPEEEEEEEQGIEEEEMQASEEEVDQAMMDEEEEEEEAEETPPPAHRRKSHNRRRERDSRVNSRFVDDEAGYDEDEDE